MKCQLCTHYHYQVGIAMSLQIKAGMTGRPTRPTCTCDYAKISWERIEAEVRKPRGIPCDYQPRRMTCVECGQTVKGKAVSVVLNREKCACKECVEILAQESERREAQTDGQPQNLP